VIKTAVVILNWNTRKQLELFLPILIRNTPDNDSEIIVADNASTDDSVEFIRKTFPSIHIIELDKNYGFAEGYNRALAQIKATYFVLINSDIEVTANWLSPLITLLESDNKTVACMPKMLSYYERDTFEYAGAAGGYIDYLGYPFCKGRIFDSIEKDEGQFSGIYEIFWATGACLAIKADVFNNIGGLDSYLFAHMEEIDLCWRLKRLGYQIYYCPESSVYHVGGGTLPNNNPRKLYYNYRNNLYLLFKNLKGGNYLTVFFPRMFLDFISAIVYLMKGQVSFFFAVFRAYFRFIINLKRLYIKRHIFNKIIARNKVSQIYNGSIVYAFFVRKVRSFNELDF